MSPATFMRSFAALSVVVMTACSSDGLNSHPAPPAPASIFKLSLKQLGGAPIQGTPGTFQVLVSAYNPSGALIDGTYSTPVTLTTTDSADLVFSGATGNSAIVTQANSPVTVSYDGKPLPAGAAINAVSNTIQAQALNVTGNGGGTQQILSGFSLVPSGGALTLGFSGSLNLVLLQYDQNGALITGNYSSPITLSTNDNTDLNLSATSFTSSNQVIIVSYNGMPLSNATLTGTGPGNITSAVTVVSSASTLPSQFTALSLSTQGAAAIKDGSAGSATIQVTAYQNGTQAITGTYPSSVFLSSSNTAAVGFAASGSSTGQPTYTLSNGSLPVSLIYTGTGTFHGTVITATVPGLDPTRPVTTSITL